MGVQSESTQTNTNQKLSCAVSPSSCVAMRFRLRVYRDDIFLLHPIPGSYEIFSTDTFRETVLPGPGVSCNRLEDAGKLKICSSDRVQFVQLQFLLRDVRRRLENCGELKKWFQERQLDLWFTFGSKILEADLSRQNKSAGKRHFKPRCSKLVEPNCRCQRTSATESHARINTK